MFTDNAVSPTGGRVGNWTAERRPGMFDVPVVTKVQGWNAYSVLVGMMVERLDTLVLNDAFRRAAGLTESQLIQVVQQLQTLLFPSEFLDRGEYDPAGGLVPTPRTLGVGSGRVVAAQTVFAEHYNDSAELVRGLVAEHKALIERHRAERARMQERLAIDPEGDGIDSPPPKRKAARPAANHPWRFAVTQ